MSHFSLEINTTMGDVCIDTITNRPRTPNDQYTFLSDEQIGNIKQVSN